MHTVLNIHTYQVVIVPKTGVFDLSVVAREPSSRHYGNQAGDEDRKKLIFEYILNESRRKIRTLGKKQPVYVVETYHTRC
jgi:hypothetical protein